LCYDRERRTASKTIGRVGTEHQLAQSSGRAVADGHCCGSGFISDQLELPVAGAVVPVVLDPATGTTLSARGPVGLAVPASDAPPFPRRGFGVPHTSSTQHGTLGISPRILGRQASKKTQKNSPKIHSLGRVLSYYMRISVLSMSISELSTQVIKMFTIARSG
jgi:hypothetical protein